MTTKLKEGINTLRVDNKGFANKKTAGGYGSGYVTIQPAVHYTPALSLEQQLAQQNDLLKTEIARLQKELDEAREAHMETIKKFEGSFDEYGKRIGQAAASQGLALSSVFLEGAATELDEKASKEINPTQATMLRKLAGFMRSLAVDMRTISDKTEVGINGQQIAVGHPALR